MSIASRTSSRTSPHQSRAPPPADVFLENWTVAAGQCRVASADGDRDCATTRARCRVHVCVVSNKNHASNSRPHARNTSNTKITSTRLESHDPRHGHAHGAQPRDTAKQAGDASNLIAVPSASLYARCLQSATRRAAARVACTGTRVARGCTRRRLLCRSRCRAPTGT